ncbi:hypothetical protein P691DRAFT_808030 [Macrolepiota fuliginosa MF-IS2]|uniref:DUF6534 domain-containing protein n=1 Tax=Macrolepiota fuliginosa MF-IS2 TaxID=1400762 RepID=A0A9P5X5I4_9AGAR|nr:hypothetical protein P691DRAFT_808030 [Macrolepiota fuliginosa MF-IS2]
MDVVEPVLGAIFTSTIISAGLFGAFTLQCWTYFSRFPDDRAMLKLTVSSTWALTLAKFILGIRGSYLTTIKSWGDISAIGQPTWSVRIILVFTICLALLTHLFYIHKIWTLLRRAFLFPLLLLIASMTGFGIGMAAYVLSIMARHYQDLDLADDLTMGAFGCTFAVDWSITISLVVLMKKQVPIRSRSIRRLLKNIVSYIVNVGLVISLTDIVVLVLLNVHPDPYTLYSISLYDIVGNLYANSMLACLNSRPSIPEEEAPVDLERRDDGSRKRHSQESVATIGPSITSNTPIIGDSSAVFEEER